jgi:hypothetical protein
MTIGGLLLAVGLSAAFWLLAFLLASVEISASVIASFSLIAAALSFVLCRL